MELITIKTFDNLMEAHFMKSMLESENIICFLFDENVVGLNPLYNITVGGIKLKINKLDLQKATLIIDASEKTKLTNELEEIIKCPRCQSEDINYGYKSMKGMKGILSLFISLLFMVFPIYVKRTYKCEKCGNEFK